MKKIRIILLQTVMVSFMIFCYISLYGLFVMRPYDYCFDWYIPGSVILASFLCSLFTCILLYVGAEKNSESKFYYYFRIAIHFVLLYLIIMCCGRLFCWYSSVQGFIFTSIIYIIVYIATWGATWLIYKHEDKIITQALNKIRDEE